MSRTAPAAARRTRRHFSAQHRFLLTLAATTALSLGATMAPAWAEPITPIPDGYDKLEGLGGGRGEALAVSGDGKTVVGRSYLEAFYWTATDGTQPVGLLPSTSNSTARAVNADGSVIVGDSGNIAFRWTADGGIQTLSGVNALTSFAFGVSADGSAVVGYQVVGGYAGAFLWTTDHGGTVTELGTLKADNSGNSAAVGISSNGLFVVGDAENDDDNLNHAFRWTTEGGMQDLGVLQTGYSSAAKAVNTDGSVVVGLANTSDGYRAFRWTQGGTMESLDTLAGGSFSKANALSKDGSIIVGESATDDQNRGFVWTEQTQMITVEEWLRNSGVSVSHDFTQNATGISADGTVIVGTTEYSSAYIARSGSGIIDVEQFARSLSGSPSARTSLDQASTALNGLHGDPMRNRLDAGRQYLQISTDGGYDKSDVSNGGLVITDLTYAYGFEGGITARIAAGGLYTDQNLEAGGDFNQKGLFISPEVTLPVTGAIYATVSGYYGSSSLHIDRGYLNGGALDYSQGKTDVDSWAARVRFDWLDAFKLQDTSMTPYTSLTYAHSRMDAYTETGGGFPARFDESTDHATVWRLGVDGVTPLNDQFRVLTRGEVAYRFEDKTAGTTGEIIGLSGFSFDGQDTDRVWLRGGVGAEFDVAGGTATFMLNASTQGNDPSLWVKTAWKVSF
ncbi:autotransporter domain-containing protein [Agrobacterium sp. Azo12]|uniref:autotransporter domain-containing protein n=1 Tax=Agrobacterium sp. Azo12 TaxID=3031129 RepID=UPI0023D8BCE3|nr:autotransporter domain-containing protein [Agrobacterium sp. Azo12]MDO5895523.1 autotransporter domain-containing protein [Agrobacterium sp. Azo12]